MSTTLNQITQMIKEKFRFSTLSFIFIIAYVNIFQAVFGMENNIAGIIFTIMMSASMVRDLTATPFRHLFTQAAVLVLMALAAYGVTVFPAPWSLLINIVTLFLVLYAYTYEYSNHIYFPYILSYLFLIFISPVTEASHLPMRLLSMLAGAVSILLYQWFMGRKRVAETARDVLSEIIDDICKYLAYRRKETAECPDLSDTRRKLCRLSKTVYERRKKVLCVSDAGFSMIDAGRGLEHLLILLHELPEETSQTNKNVLQAIDTELNVFRSFLHQEIRELPPMEPSGFTFLGDETTTELFYRAFLYIRDRLLHMTDPQNRNHYRKTALSLKIRIQAALDVRPVRVIYAFRTALLLSLATLLVQQLALPHGKWFLFTLASVSLPYADDVPVKMKKRILATIIGGLTSVLIYSLIPSGTGRTAAMMLSGYLSFYFTNYTQTFACSTVGALGGAVFMSSFEFQDVFYMFFIRLGYILAGAFIAFLIHYLICPFRRSRATRQLWKKYKKITDLLTRISHAKAVDSQLYYNLIIQAHMLEEKLTQNADLENWSEFPRLLDQCRERVRQAHRSRIPERADAPVFEPGHLI